MSEELNVAELTGSISLEDQFSSALERLVEHAHGALTELEGGFGLVGIAAVTAAGLIGGATASIVALGSKGSTLQGVEDAFDRLAKAAGTTGDALRDNLSEGVKGTIDNMVLMQSTMRLMSSGMKLTADDATTLGEAARAMGKATGTDAASGLQTLSSALLTGRTRSLAMSGIVVDLKGAQDDFAKSLGTTADKLNAEGILEAKRIAILQATKDYVDRLGVSELTFKERLQQGGVAIEEWGANLAKAVAGSPNVLRAFDAIGAALKNAFGGDAKSFSDLIVNVINKFADAVTTYAPPVIKWVGEIKDKVVELWPIVVGWVTAAATAASQYGPVVIGALTFIYKTVLNIYDAVMKAWDLLPTWFQHIAQDATAAAAAMYLVSKATGGISGPDILTNLASVAQIWSVFGKNVGVATLAMKEFAIGTALLYQVGGVSAVVGTLGTSIGTMVVALATNPVVLITALAAALIALAGAVANFGDNWKKGGGTLWGFLSLKDDNTFVRKALGLSAPAPLTSRSTGPTVPMTLPSSVPSGLMSAAGADPNNFLKPPPDYSKQIQAMVDTWTGAGKQLIIVKGAFNSLTDAQKDNADVQEQLIPILEQLMLKHKGVTQAMADFQSKAVDARIALVAQQFAMLVTNGVTLQSIKTLQDRGYSEDEIAIKLNVSREALQKYEAEMKAVQDVEHSATLTSNDWIGKLDQTNVELTKVSREGLTSFLKATQDYNDLVAKGSMNDTDFQARQIQQSTDLQIAGLNKQGEKAQETADLYKKIGAQQVADLYTDNAALQANTFKTLDDIAAKDATTYETMAAHPELYSAVVIQHFKDIAQASSDTAKGLNIDSQALVTNSFAALKLIAEKDKATYEAMKADPDDFSKATIAHFKEIAKQSDDTANGISQKWKSDLADLSTSLTQLAQVSGGTFGGIVKNIANVVSSLDLAVKSVDKFKDAQTTPAGKVAAGAGAAAGFLQATDPSQSGAFGAVLGGVATGAAIGSIFPGPGTAIGAIVGGIVGLIRSMQEATKEAHKLADAIRLAGKYASDFGSTTPFSDQLNQQITNTQARVKIFMDSSAFSASSFGFQLKSLNDGFGILNELSESLNLSDVLTEMGDLTKLDSTQVADLGQKFKDLQNIIKAGGALAVTATKEMDDSLVELGNAAVAANTFVGKMFTDTVAGAKAAGTVLTQTAAFMKTQAESSATGLSTMFGGLDASAKAKVKAAGGSDDDVAKAGFTLSSPTQAAGLGASVAGAFAGMIKNGDSMKDTLTALSGPIATLDAALAKSGMDGGAAFGRIGNMAKIANDDITGPLVDAIDGAQQAMLGLGNTGMLNQKTFSALSGTATDAYNQIISQGKDGDAALQLMQPTLQTMWEAEQQFGFTTDSATQALIDQGVQQGIVGEQGKDAQGKILDVLLAIADALGAAVPAGLENMTKAGSDAAGTLQKDMGGAADAIKNKFSTLPSRFDVNVNTDFTQTGTPPPIPDPPVHVATGGLIYAATGRVLPFTPKGTDTIPAMLSPGEMVLNFSQQSVVGALLQRAIGGAYHPPDPGITTNMAATTGSVHDGQLSIENMSQAAMDAATALKTASLGIADAATHAASALAKGPDSLANSVDGTVQQLRLVTSPGTKDPNKNATDPLAIQAQQAQLAAAEAAKNSLQDPGQIKYPNAGDIVQNPVLDRMPVITTGDLGSLTGGNTGITGGMNLGGLQFGYDPSLINHTMNQMTKYFADGTSPFTPKGSDTSPAMYTVGETVRMKGQEQSLQDELGQQAAVKVNAGTNNWQIIVQVPEGTDMTDPDAVSKALVTALRNDINFIRTGFENIADQRIKAAA